MSIANSVPIKLNKHSKKCNILLRKKIYHKCIEDAYTFPIKCSEADQPEETALCRLVCPASSDSADTSVQQRNKIKSQ